MNFTKYFFLFAILIVSFLLPMLFRSPASKAARVPDEPRRAPLSLLVLSAALLAASAALSVHFYKKRALL